MHSYLKSIGFSDIEKKKDIDKLLDEIVRDYDDKIVVENEKGHLYAEISKEYGINSGITVFGEYDENDVFQKEYWYPYFRGTQISSREEVIIEKHADKESYAGACDDIRVGVTLIFYLQNVGDYLLQKGRELPVKSENTVSLSGLAKDGKIILPVKKHEWAKDKDGKAVSNRNHLIAAARNGDEEAIENLTMEDIDTYTMISRRILHEDVFSIVESYFMPYGMECDQYNVMGEILECTETTNYTTKEIVYQMTLECNDICLEVCINAKDLMGEPKVGRRFKGTIWLQGRVDF